MYNYVVTAHKPSRVTHTAVGNFLAPDQRNLLVAKVNHIEVYAITPDGLVATVVIPIYGTIAVMQLMKQPGDQQHSLIILTEKLKLCILKWSIEDARCHVISTCDTHDHCAPNPDAEVIGVVEPQGRCIALHQNPRLLRIIPTAPEADKTSFNVRLLEDSVYHMVFLHGCELPTIAILGAYSKDSNQLRTYTISLNDQDMTNSSWSKTDLDPTTNRLVPIAEPHGGVLILADEAITYVLPSGDEVSVPIDTAIITAVEQVGSDTTRYLIGDHKGQLMMLMLVFDDSGCCNRLKVETLGEISTPHWGCISYLDSGFVFIGSNNGDAQLIKLSTSPIPPSNTYVKVVTTFSHLGPIVDFCIVKGMGYLRQGQGQVVTCSGVGKDGSLRIIRNGIGIAEHASEQLPGIKELFSLRRSFKDRYDRYLVQSFTAETRMLELISAEEMAPASLVGFDEKSRTLYAGNMAGDIIVQVTAAGVRVVDCGTMSGHRDAVWTPPGDVRISVASGNARQILVGTTGGNLVLLSVDVAEKTIVERGHRKMANEISCVNCNVLVADSDMSDSDRPAAADGETSLAAVGLWAEVGEKPVVEMVSLPSLRSIEQIQVGGDTIARGVLLATLEKHHYLVVALGDGSLVTFTINMDAVRRAAVKAEDKMNEKTMDIQVASDKRKLTVGTKPAELRLFKSKGGDHIFVACDRPTVVYSSTGGGKLLVSNVNLQEMTRVCGFDTEGFPECLAIATETGLHLGAVDEIQKLHVTTVPLGEQPRRIEHLESSRVFTVFTERTVLDEGGDEMVDHYLRVIDDSRYDTLDRYKFRGMECGSSCVVCRLSGDNIDKEEEFLAVGTAVMRPNEEDPKEGRILIMRIVDGQVVVVGEKTVEGAVFKMCCYEGMLLASVGHQVVLLSVSGRKDGMLEMREEDRHAGHLLAFQISLRGDFIVLGDLLRSVQVLTCKRVGGQFRLEEVAKHNDMTWVVALELLDDETYVVAEHGKHLMTFKRKSRAATEAERGRLERVGQYHLGGRVNRIEHGSLVMQMADMDGPAINTLIFGTTDGMLGVIAQLKEEAFEFFAEVENAMATLIPGVGGLKHAEWREMVHQQPPRAAPARNFVDGDLIERFLDLSASQMARVSAMVNVSVEDLVQRIEEMQRLHGAG